MPKKPDYRINELMRGLDIYPPEIEQLSASIDGIARKVLIGLDSGDHSLDHIARDHGITKDQAATLSYYLRSRALARVHTIRNYDGRYAGAAISITRKGQEVRKKLLLTQTPSA